MLGLGKQRDMTSTRAWLRRTRLELRTLFEWGLVNWSHVQPAIGSRVHASRESLVQALGQLGDDRTRALLESHLEDHEISLAVVAAIGAIEARQAAM